MVVTKEGVANDANAEKKAEFDNSPPSKQPTEAESAPSTTSVSSIPRKSIFPKLPGEIGMAESRWAKEDASPISGNPRRGGRISRPGRGGSPSGVHSPSSSRQGSIPSLPRSQENWNRNNGRAQGSSNWGDDSAGAEGANGGGWGSDLKSTPQPGDEAYAWGSDPIVEEAKQLKDGWGTESVPAGKNQPQIDSVDWSADTVPAEVYGEHGAKEGSLDWGAKTESLFDSRAQPSLSTQGISLTFRRNVSGNADYSQSRPARAVRGAYGGYQEHGRLNAEIDEISVGWNSPSIHKHPEEGNVWDTGASPQTKYGKNEASDDWATAGPADFSAPRSARGGGGGGHGYYQKGGRGWPRGRGSWKGVTQSAYNRSTDAKVGTEPAGWGQENTEPSWGDDSNFAAAKAAENSSYGQDLNDSESGQPGRNIFKDVSKKPQDAGSPSIPAHDPTSTWDNAPGWQPSKFKKHEPKW